MINSNYYRVHFDSSLWPFWKWGDFYDKNGDLLEGRSFTFRKKLDGKSLVYGKYLNILDALPITVDVDDYGQPLTFNFTIDGVPLTMPNIAREVSRLVGNPDLLETVDVTSRRDGSLLTVLNVLDVVDCFDWNNSVYETTWKEEDGRPEFVGNPRGVYFLKIRHEAAAGHHLFFVKGWEGAYIVSQEMKDLLLRVGATGLKFTPV